MPPHILAMFIALPIALAGFTIIVQPQPLLIEKSDFDRDWYFPGDAFLITSTGRKKWWGYSFCEATDSRIVIRGSDGRIWEYQTPKNYNDGKITIVSNMKRMPVDIQAGQGLGWEAVTYKCFGFWDTTTIPGVFGKFNIRASKG